MALREIQQVELLFRYKHLEAILTNREKLADVIADELDTMSKAKHPMVITDSLHRYFMAERLASRLVDDERRYRSGRRISDAVRDKLLDLQKWVMRK